MDYTYRDMAKMIDHSLLNPTLTGKDLEEGCRVAVTYDVASVCIMPYYLARCAELLRGSTVKASTTVGFPHGGHTTGGSSFGRGRARVADGGQELGHGRQHKQGAERGGLGLRAQRIKAVVDVCQRAGQKVKSFRELLPQGRPQDPPLRDLRRAAGRLVKDLDGYGSGGATHADLNPHAKGMRPPTSR